jgi:hypothetical protein
MWVRAWQLKRQPKQKEGYNQDIQGQSEPAPTSAPWRMDGKWSGNSFLLDSNPLANHGG